MKLSNQTSSAKIHFYKIAIILLCLGLFSSCDWIEQSIKETNDPKPEKSASRADQDDHKRDITATKKDEYTSLFADSAKLAAAQTALQNLPKFRGKTIQFEGSMLFYDFQGGYITLNIQDPDKPENLDKYTYDDGKWGSSQPVNTSGRKGWEEHLENLNEVKFTTVKKINDIIEEKKKAIEGAKKVSHIYYSSSNTDYYWRASIRGDRKNYTINFKKNGDLNLFNMN